MRDHLSARSSSFCSCCCVAGWGLGFPIQVARAAEEYGYHMGLAFQIVDDILDIVGAADVGGTRCSFTVACAVVAFRRFFTKCTGKEMKNQVSCGCRLFKALQIRRGRLRGLLV